MLKLKLKLKLKRFFDSGRLHQFISPLLYSTSDNCIALVDTLVNSVGFSQDEAVSIAANCKPNLRFKSHNNYHLVVDFLKSTGLDDTHIRNYISANPYILRSNVEKTLKPIIRVLQDLGFGSIVSEGTQSVHKNLKRDSDCLVPSFEMLKSLFDSNEELFKFMVNTNLQKLLSSSARKYLPQNLLLLQSYGVPRERVKRLLTQNANFLFSRTEWVENIVKGVEEKLGIRRTSPMFMIGVCALKSKSNENFEKWRQVFFSYGWSEAQVSGILRKQPSCLNLSEKNMRAKLKYYMDELGLDCDYLAKCPNLLLYSMEKRVLPRTAFIQALKEKQILKSDHAVSTLVSYTESKFMEIYVLPVKDKLPLLYENYIQAKDRSLAKS